jgi:hypothetical protein
MRLPGVGRTCSANHSTALHTQRPPDVVGTRRRERRPWLGELRSHGRSTTFVGKSILKRICPSSWGAPLHEAAHDARHALPGGGVPGVRHRQPYEVQQHGLHARREHRRRRLRLRSPRAYHCLGSTALEPAVRWHSRNSAAAPCTAQAAGAQQGTNRTVQPPRLHRQMEHSSARLRD